MVNLDDCAFLDKLARFKIRIKKFYLQYYSRKWISNDVIIYPMTTQNFVWPHMKCKLTWLDPLKIVFLIYVNNLFIKEIRSFLKSFRHHPFPTRPKPFLTLIDVFGRLWSVSKTLQKMKESLKFKNLSTMRLNKAQRDLFRKRLEFFSTPK